MIGTLLLYNYLKLHFLILFYQSKQLTDYIYTAIYCKLSKCIGQTPCSYEHYLVFTRNLSKAYMTRDSYHQGYQCTTCNKITMRFEKASKF